MTGSDAYTRTTRATYLGVAPLGFLNVCPQSEAAVTEFHDDLLPLHPEHDLSLKAVLADNPHAVYRSRLHPYNCHPAVADTRDATTTVHGPETSPVEVFNGSVMDEASSPTLQTFLRSSPTHPSVSSCRRC